MKNYTQNLLTKISASDFFFRLGLSCFFLLNSLTAWFSPDEFTELTGSNPILSAIASPSFWVKVIGTNDALVFLLILSGRWRKVVAIWAGIWMVGVFYVTIPNGWMDLVEHIGIMSLVIYYYFNSQRFSAEQPIK